MDQIFKEDAASCAMSRLREEIAKPPFHALLKLQALSADERSQTVVVGLQYRSEFGRSRAEAAYHGGVIASLIDIAGHAAVAIWAGRMTPTIDLRIDYLRAASASDLFATARVLRAGRSIARADVEVRNDRGAVVAVGRGTYSTLSEAS
jgi:uncharacterized protein (TIGR00369 family)